MSTSLFMGYVKGKSARMILHCHADLKIEIFGRCYVSMIGMNIVIHSRTTPNQIEAKHKRLERLDSISSYHQSLNVNKVKVRVI